MSPLLPSWDDAREIPLFVLLSFSSFEFLRALGRSKNHRFIFLRIQFNEPVIFIDQSLDKRVSILVICGDPYSFNMIERNGVG